MNVNLRNCEAIVTDTLLQHIQIKNGDENKFKETYLSNGELFAKREGTEVELYIGDGNGNNGNLKYINQGKIEEVNERISRVYEHQIDLYSANLDILKILEKMVTNSRERLDKNDDDIEAINRNLFFKKEQINYIKKENMRIKPKLRIALIFSILSFLEMNIIFILNCLGIL